MPHKRAKRSVREQRKSQYVSIPTCAATIPKFSRADHAPASKYAVANEAIPKSVSRVLNAAKVQQDYAERKRRREAGEDVDGGPRAAKRRKSEEGIAGKKADKKAALKISPGESIAQFNRRVENAMRSEVRDAVKASAAHEKKFRKEEQTTKAEKQPSSKKPAAENKRAQEAEAESPAPPPPKPTAKGKERAADEEPKDFARLASSAPKRLNDIVQAPPEINKLPRGAAKIAARASEGSEKTSLRDGMMSMAQKAMLEEERLRAVRLYREMKRAKMGG